MPAGRRTAVDTACAALSIAVPLSLGPKSFALPHYRVVPIRDKFWWREDRSEAQIISETDTIALIDDASLSVFAERLLKTMRCLTREDVK